MSARYAWGRSDDPFALPALAAMSSPGATELLIVLVIVLLIFGPKRLPALGRQLGAGIREFKSSITGSGSGEPPREPRLEKPAGGPADEAERRPAP